jgi:hypothetical protein
MGRRPRECAVRVRLAAPPATTSARPPNNKATSALANTICTDCHPPENTIPGLGQELHNYGCHTVAGQQQHASTATLSEHSLATSLTTEAPAGLGCSASPGTGSYVRTPCHTTDLIQEHNRKIGGFEPGFVQVIHTTVAVSCEECHSSAAFRALNSPWNGTCDACHPANHTAVGSSRYNEVRALHQYARFYDGGYSSSTGAPVEASTRWIPTGRSGPSTTGHLAARCRCATHSYSRWAFQLLHA